MTHYGDLYVTENMGRQMKFFGMTAKQATLALRFHGMLGGKPVEDLETVRKMVGSKNRPLVVDGVNFGEYRLEAVSVDWCHIGDDETPVLTDVSLHLRIKELMK